MKRSKGKKLTKEEIKKYKFVKVMFEDKSSVGNQYQYKSGELNVADNWNPKTTDPEIMGGFNITIITSVIRWLNKGNTIYEVVIPDGAEVYDCWYPETPNVVFRTNKIVVQNPKKIDDDYAMKLYKISNLNEDLYPKVMTNCVKRNFKNTTYKIIEEKINNNNILETIKEFEYSLRNRKNNIFNENELTDFAKEIYEKLKRINKNL